MFELSVAWKYLLPRRRQLSVSIISLISVLVISLVVWLILVFFSVANGLERMWVDRMIAMSAPVRLTPTDDYYQSYYYRIDGLSDASNYAYKSLSEKALATVSDPYDPEVDAALPSQFYSRDIDQEGKLKDLVKEVYASAEKIPGVIVSPYEMAYGNMQIQMVRDTSLSDPSYINQSVYLGSFDPTNSALQKSLLSISERDIENLMGSISRTSSEKSKLLQEIKPSRLKTPASGWQIPRDALPEKGNFKIIALLDKSDQISKIIVAQSDQENDELFQRYQEMHYPSKKGTLALNKLTSSIYTDSGTDTLDKKVPLIVTGGLVISGAIDPKSLIGSDQERFDANIQLQGNSWKKKIPMKGLQIVLGKEVQVPSSFWAHKTDSGVQLPNDKSLGEPILLPKTYREGGVLVGDQGYLSYYVPTTSSVQEQRVPAYVAGFFDQGISPIGGKFAMVDPEVTAMIRSAYSGQDQSASTGIHLRFNDLARAEEIKQALKADLAAKGVDRYWNIETYEEYDFTRDLIQQLKSEKHLFSLIAGVIIIVACSNIISMLIILVNDKKMEIGILRAMGASSRSIAVIFGFCGMIMGLAGSLLGILLAVFTLFNLDSLIGFIGWLQGYDVFNASLYGETLPNQLSSEALTFVLAATVITSLIAGIVPAVKASLLKPSEILRAE